MTNIGVVILNYISYEVTIECVEYFKKQFNKNYNCKLIVVDNDSPNNSFEILNKRFKDEESIVVIKSKKNLGFAKGNNLGYRVLLKYMKIPDFVIASNSDAFVKDCGLFDWIVDSYKKYKFGVLGPAIYSVRGSFYQSPLDNMPTDLHGLKKYRQNLRLILCKAYIRRLLHLYPKTNVEIWDNKYSSDVHFDKTLHGAFQIFSREYLKIFGDLYDSRTFMYMEENILRCRCEINNLPMVYSPAYTVYHLQAVSTSKATNDTLKRRCFKFKNMLKSLKVYTEYVKENF